MKFFVGPSPFELRPPEILKRVGEWHAKDWLYSEEEDVFSYRPNLLIRLERDRSKDNRVYSVLYGYQVVGQAELTTRRSFWRAITGSAPEKLDLRPAWQPGESFLVSLASKG
jgi:hypothetical protein